MAPELPNPRNPLRAPAGLPPRIRTDASNAFAHHTMTVRVPAILDDVLRDNSDYDPMLCERIRALQLALRTDARLPPLGGGVDARGWQVELAVRAGEGWLSTDWFFAENYAYRRLADAVEFWQSGRDPFAPTKLAEYASRAHREALEATVAIAGPDALERLLLADVFANRMDLSFAPSRERGTGASSVDLLHDDRSRACELLAQGNGAVHFVIDNAGTELSLDLVLAAHLLEILGAPVVLHVKVHPAFVSDAIEHDVRWFIEGNEARAAALWSACSEAARRCRQVLREGLAGGRLRIVPHPFWNGPASLWALPHELALEFAAARLVILKGDAHYRRAVGDALWAPETSFTELTRYFPAPLLALRTLKSDAIVGLPKGMAARLDAEDPGWRVNGQRAVASLGGTIA